MSLILFSFSVNRVFASCTPNYPSLNYPNCDCSYNYRCTSGGNFQFLTCVAGGCGGVWTTCSPDDPSSAQCYGGGSCGGTRGSCSGDCPSGQTCRAPSNPGNGDTCSCHGSMGGSQYVCTNWANTCRKGSSCTGNEIAGPLPGGCSGGCRSTQVCCSQRSCTTISPIDPIGEHYAPTCDVGIGWACDESDFAQPVTVGFYADGLQPQNFIGSDVANKTVTDPASASTVAAVAALCGNHGNRFFKFTTPPSLKDGQNHTIYAEAIDIGLGDNKLLSGTPRTINCAPPPISCTGTVPSNNPTISSNLTTYVVSAVGVTNADTVSFKVNSLKHPGTIHTYPGVKQAGTNTWNATVNFAAYHNDDVGAYNVDVVMGGLAGTKLCGGGADFTRNMTPTFVNMTVKNSADTAVAWDAGKKNHICKAGFQNSTIPRKVTFSAVLNDGDGGDDIALAKLKWNNIVYPMTLSGISGNYVTASVTITYPNTVETNNNLPILIQYNDQADAGTGIAYVVTGYSWKVWDCSVPVTQSIFDGSTGQACNNTGFSTLAGSDMNFTGLIYKNMSGGTDVTSNMVWKDSYLPLVNGGTVSNIDGDLVASGRFTRLIDTGAGGTICPSASQFNTGNSVSAYDIEPGLQVDLSYIQDQESWFQGRGIDIRAQNEISSGVPVTANSTLIVDNTSIGTSNGGVVASASYRNTNGWNDNTQYGSPNNWRANTKLIDSQKNNYQTMYNDYFVKLGLGTTGVTSVGTGSTGILFANGNLNINTDIVVPANKYLMVITNGLINIGAGASRVDGIYISNGNISVGGTSDSQLILNGILYATNSSDIIFTRTFGNKTTNNTTPAVVVNYRPDMIFALPGKLNKVLSGWREN